MGAENLPNSTVQICAATSVSLLFQPDDDVAREWIEVLKESGKIDREGCFRRGFCIGFDDFSEAECTEIIGDQLVLYYGSKREKEILDAALGKFANQNLIFRPRSSAAQNSKVYIIVGIDGQYEREIFGEGNLHKIDHGCKNGFVEFEGGNILAYLF